MTVGQYVEELLGKDRYCEAHLPRVTAATKRTLLERLSMYEQFRERYAQNLEVLDRFEEGDEQNVSIGMLICPGRGQVNWRDLTRSRGTSNHKLMEKCREIMRQSAVATGKDYCKTSGQSMIRAGGALFVVGAKRCTPQVEEEEEIDEETLAREAKKRRETQEAEAKKAEIEARYCSRTSTVIQSRKDER